MSAGSSHAARPPAASPPVARRTAAALTRGGDGILRLAVAGGAPRRLAEGEAEPALAALAAEGPLFLGVDAPLGGAEGLRETDRICGLGAPRRHDPALTDALAALHGHEPAIWPFGDAAERVGAAHVLAAEALGGMLSPDIAAAGGDDDTAARLLAEALAGLLEGDAAALLPPISRPAILCEGRPELMRAALPARARPPRLKDDCFAMPQGVDWIPVDEALARLRAGLSPVAQTEFLAPGDAAGRVLAAPARAMRANPPAPNSAVDGYGFAHAATGAGVQRLPLAEGRAAAGGPLEGAVPPAWPAAS